MRDGLHLVSSPLPGCGNYESGSGTASLIFAHVVVEPKISIQLIAVLSDTLELSGLVKVAIPNSESHSIQKGHSEC